MKDYFRAVALIGLALAEGCIHNCPYCDYPTSCLDVLERDPGMPSGTQEILLGGVPTTVYCDMEAAGGGWTQVGRIEGTGDWIEGDDLLAGSSPVGAPGADPHTGDSYMLGFESFDGGDLLFATGDGTAFGVIAHRDALATNVDQFGVNALVKASSGTQAEAGELTNVLLRGDLEDPWIGFAGDHDQNTGEMFYGENGIEVHTEFKNLHGGIDVFVRADCMARGTLDGHSCICDEGYTGFMCESPGSPTADAGWPVHGGGDDAHLGWGVHPAGDVDGDGYDDVLVDAPGLDGGRTLLYPGSHDGLAVEPAWSGDGAWTTSAAGDADGDGAQDVFVGSSLASDGAGSVSLYAGDGVSLGAKPAWTVQFEAYAGFGSSVATGDVNGDGADDLLVGADRYTDGEQNEGAAFLYLDLASHEESAAWHLEPNQRDAFMGGDVRIPGDVDGDGLHEVLVAAQGYDDDQGNEGQVWLFLGAPEGPSTTPDWTANGNEAGANLGATSAGCDVNSDGYADVLAAGLRDWVWLGGPGGPDRDFTWVAPDYYTGSRISCLGDVDGDGFGDLGVSTLQYSASNMGGVVHIFHGSADGPSPGSGEDLAGDQRGWAFGTDISGVGDVNADGADDFVVGAPNASVQAFEEGMAWLYLGPFTAE